MKRERAEKNAYKEKAIALEKANEFLMEQVASLQRCLEAKIFDLDNCSRDSMLHKDERDLSFLSDHEGTGSELPAAPAEEPYMSTPRVDISTMSAPCTHLPAATKELHVPPPWAEVKAVSSPCLEPQFSHRADGSVSAHLIPLFKLIICSRMLSFKEPPK